MKVLDHSNKTRKNINHPYAQVVCTNKGELSYVLQWAKTKEKSIPDFMWNVNKFPIHLFLSDNIVGWTDSTDRIGDKISFSEFSQTADWS